MKKNFLLLLVILSLYPQLRATHLRDIDLADAACLSAGVLAGTSMYLARNISRANTLEKKAEIANRSMPFNEAKSLIDENSKIKKWANLANSVTSTFAVVLTGLAENHQIEKEDAVRPICLFSLPCVLAVCSIMKKWNADKRRFAELERRYT